MAAFESRQEAGYQLGQELIAYSNKDTVILAIPRGGVPIGYEIAKKMHAPLSIIGVRKIGSPLDPEFAIGAIAEKQTIILDEETIEAQHIPKNIIEHHLKKEKAELQRRTRLYRKDVPLPEIKGKHVIIVDDGLATGLTAKAGIIAVSKMHPKSILYAAPVCSADSLQQLVSVVNNVVCLLSTPEMHSIGEWYENFLQVSDEEVIDFLKKNYEENITWYQNK